MKMEEVKIIPKVWGKEIWMANTELYCGKKLILQKGKRCSLHYHKNKDETFYIDTGKVLMEVDGKKGIMISGEAILIESNTNHRFSGLENSVIIEISMHHEDSDSYGIDGQLSGDIPKEIMEEYGV